jgi:hypothetical protein
VFRRKSKNGRSIVKNVDEVRETVRPPELDQYAERVESQATTIKLQKTHIAELHETIARYVALTDRLRATNDDLMAGYDQLLATGKEMVAYVAGLSASSTSQPQ